MGKNAFTYKEGGSEEGERLGGGGNYTFRNVK